VGALGHYLERAGIPTTGISLVREHTEVVRPPRALWVTFELGRPLGVPDDAAFQRRVLKAALKLFERTDGPLIADYPEEVPEPADLTGWACPIMLPGTQAAAGSAGTLAAEVDSLGAWHGLAVRGSGRSTVGVSGLAMPAAAALVAQALDGRFAPANLLKQAIDDLKAYYLEAAAVFPTPGTPAERKAWLWGETAFGRALLALQPKLAAADDAGLRLLGNLTLVPATERHRLNPA